MGFSGLKERVGFCLHGSLEHPYAPLESHAPRRWACYSLVQTTSALQTQGWFIACARAIKQRLCHCCCWSVCSKEKRDECRERGRKDRGGKVVGEARMERRTSWRKQKDGGKHLMFPTSGEKRSSGPAKHVSDGCRGMSDTRGRLHVGLGGKCGRAK